MYSKLARVIQMASEVILQRQSLLESGIRTGVKDVENRSIDTKEREKLGAPVISQKGG